jgi:hypothetical protein
MLHIRHPSVVSNKLVVIVWGSARDTGSPFDEAVMIDEAS